MAHIDSIKSFAGGGMNTDDAYELIAPNDYVSATNLRNTGTGGSDAGYESNIESNSLLAGMLLAGINDVNGGGAFDDTRQAAIFRTNSAGNNQILLYDYDTDSYTPIYTDLTDSAGQVLLPLNPANWVNCILINQTYLIWTAANLEVGYTNLKTLASGGYGTVLAEDLSLLKPQCLIPPTGTYGSDNGQAANYLYGKLPQFIVQYVNTDFNYSAWSTRSKRIVPYQQNTPVLGVDVTQNNYIVVSVNIGSIRADTINIACQFDDSGLFSTIKTVQRSYVTALTHTTVDVDTEILEAYDPATNLYSFAFYNSEVAIPIPATETDLFYDYIWPSNASEKINGNIAGLGDFETLYERPTTSVTVSAGGYNPNIDIPAGTYADPLVMYDKFLGASGSGAGNHKRFMNFTLGGIPSTNDVIIVRIVDIRDSRSILDYSYTVPSSQDGDLGAVAVSVAENIPNSSYVHNGDGSYSIYFTGPPYYTGQTFAIQLFFAGATVANSVPTVIDNTSYQLALSYYDAQGGRLFPLETDNTFIVNTPSYAQVLGNAIQFTWTINTVQAPDGAASYQWMITKAPINKILDTTAIILNYKGGWDAKTNTPTLSINSGDIGDTYQITTPCSPTDTTNYHNLGDNATYNTGDYITNTGGTSGGTGEGLSYAVLPKTFGNLAGTGGILVFSLNSLALLNSEYSDQNINTNLVYDFAPGDRCTLHYWIDGSGTKQFFNDPCIDLTVLGYDSGSYLVKVENSSALTYASGHVLYNGQQIDGFNIFLRLYSPAPNIQDQRLTVWREIGEQFSITDGNHDVLTGSFTDGGAYYKTRQFPDAVQPYTNDPVQVLATDLNYSDFYASQFSSFGRVRTYYDVLEKTEQKASIITSQSYITGSRVNGLNRFYPENIYGEGNGQTSSSKGAIQVMWQRGDVLVIGQEDDFFYIPVNIAYQQLNDQLTGLAISEKLLNNGRYESRNIGIGRAKESFCKRYDVGYFVSPYDSQPMEITLAGVQPISGKKSQYFKTIVQAAYALGKRLHMYYDNFYEELMFCIQSSNDIILLRTFGDDWNPNDSYVLVPGDITATTNGSHSTVSYNAGTGVATYTPTTDYVGGDTATFTFNPGITKNVCLNWTAGSGTVNPFSFAEVSGADLNVIVASNTILVSGNDYAVPISITGTSSPEYSINGGAWTSLAGTVNAGDTVQVRLVSSNSDMSEETATLTIDSQSAEFDVVTKALGNFTVKGKYGITIVGVNDVTTTGIPPSLSSISVPPDSSLAVAYTSVTAGNFHVNVTGSPSLPGHVRMYLAVGGSTIHTNTMIVGQTLYSFSIPLTNDPTTIEIGFETF